MEESSDPPFVERYKSFFMKEHHREEETAEEEEESRVVEEYWELPLIDLDELELDKGDKCKKQIEKAAKEWGFFQVVNHGISKEILDRMRLEQVKLHKKPFNEKANGINIDNILAGSYRWGTPPATCLKQVAWSEAFHVPLTTTSTSFAFRIPNTLRSTMEQFGEEMFWLAHKVAEVLAERLGHKATFFRETCLPSTCYLRMNRYPPCSAISPHHIFGLMPHTDSDFITVLHQDDEVGGLQLFNDGKWFAVQPRPDALIIIIGDLFQAWSNGVYKSVEHRVVTNMQKERFSTAFFMCPSMETAVSGCVEPCVYRRFSFKDYKQQVQEDVMKFGHKIGLINNWAALKVLSITDLFLNPRTHKTIGSLGNLVLQRNMLTKHLLSANESLSAMLGHFSSPYIWTNATYRYDFITVLHQDDEIGGLQLFKDGKWFAVQPRPDALIIIIGDLFPAWSNGVYKSVEHRVMTNMQKERSSIAFFMCPSMETVVSGCVEPYVYRRFSFKDYKQQVQDDVRKFGNKIGLCRFLN